MGVITYPCIMHAFYPNIQIKAPAWDFLMEFITV